MMKTRTPANRPRLFRRFLPLLASSLTALVQVAPVARAEHPVTGEMLVGTGAAFFEDFDSLDRNRWYISDGWTNGAHQNCLWSRRALALADGAIALSFLPAELPGRPANLCAEIQTKAVFGHGTFEVRLRTERASGLNAAFFTYIGPVHDQPHDEIDIEILTRNPGRVSINSFVAGVSAEIPPLPLDPAADRGFVTLGFQWTPDRISWFVEGQEIYTTTENLPSHAQKIYLSHWGSETLTDWMGPFELPEQAVQMQVDWVAFTPLGADCQFPESLLCKQP